MEDVEVVAEGVKKKIWWLRHLGFTVWLGVFILFCVLNCFVDIIHLAKFVSLYTVIYWILCLIKRKLL